MMEDMLLYGVPEEVNTKSNEGHHIPSKYAAKLTQRKESTFNKQTAERLTEFHLVGGELVVYTEHKRGDSIFRGHPNYNGTGYWRDWALVDWGADEGVVPVHIWCFLQLPAMPKGRDRMEFGGIYLQEGTYAVVPPRQWPTVQLSL